jgi:hypothetical protein
MKIIAHTKYGVFTGIEKEYSEEEYDSIADFLTQICKMSYFTFGTENGKVYMTKEMIADSLFVLEK